MSFSQEQKEVDEWIERYTPGYFDPLMMLARLTEELGELSRALSHRYGGKKPKQGEPEGEIAGEIGDLFFVLICLANSIHMDLDEVFAATMNKIRQRDARRWLE